MLIPISLRKRIQLIIPIVLFSVGFTLNFDPDDWYVIRKIGSISSITEDNFLVYLLADNGIFTIDKLSGDIEYNVQLSDKFDNPQIIYYDNYSDYFWLITRTEIFVKSSVSSYWRNIDYTDLGFDFRRTIYDIGSSPSYIWIDVGTQIVPVYSYGAKVPKKSEIDESEIDLIKWGNYSNGRSGSSLDISQFLIMDDWNVGLNTINNIDGRKIHPTVLMESSDNDIWIGTREGVLLKGWKPSHRLEIVETGPHSDYITTFFNDLNGNWWFADSPFMRTGKHLDQNFSNYITVSHWSEFDNKWSYSSIESIYDVKSKDIHDIFSIGRMNYLSSSNGLLIFDIIDNEWNILTQNNGLKDQVLWDIDFYENSLYIATKYGINEVSTLSNTVIPNKDNWIQKFDNIEIYDIETDSNFFYISSANGLYKISHENEEIEKISTRKFKKIQIIDAIIWALEYSLWRIDLEGNEIKYKDGISDFFIHEGYIWSTNGREIYLSNFKTYEDWNIPLDRGMKNSHIYSLSCDDEWVWFLTNNGIIFYNWTTYNDVQN